MRATNLEDVRKIRGEIKGKFQIHGSVTAVSATSITVKAEDGVSQTYAITSDTKVRQRTQSAQDITGAVVSVSERLKDARTERRSLLRQLAAATTTNQTSSIRARLRLVSGQIAAAKRDLRQVKSRASRSTIAVTLLADRKSDGDDDGAAGWTPGDAFDDAVRILEVTAGVLLVGLALLLPLGLVALLVWLAARQAAQRRRERALDAV